MINFCELAENLESELIYSNIDPMNYINVNGSRYKYLLLTYVTPIECENIFVLRKNSRQHIDQSQFI